MKRVDCQQAYVLHRRPYRETSLLLELLTPEYGRLTLIAKGVRKARSASQGLLQPFNPLLVSWAGKGELMSLTSQELDGQPRQLRGTCLYAGLYLNELMMALLQRWDPHPRLYAVYEQSLQALQASILEEHTLRTFEKRLLDDLGYAPLSISDISLHNSLVAEEYYRFIPEQGFIRSEQSELANPAMNVFIGKNLLAIAREEWQDTTVLRDAKRLHRILLAPLLGEKQLHSRKLFRGE